MLVNNPPVELAPRLWMLGSAAYPLYLYRGDAGATLFEGGIGPSGSLLRSQLAALEVAPQSIARIVVTHAHPDHVMALAQFRSDYPQAQVLASAPAAKTLASEKAMAFFAKLDAMLVGGLTAQGLVAPQPAEPPAAGPVTVDRVVGEGDQIDAGGATFQVLHTPGHSDCSLSFFAPHEHWLIVSDATGYYLPRQGAWWPNYFTDYGPYMASMTRLAGLGAEVLCLSHNGAIRGAEAVAAYFAGALAATREYHERIVRASQAGTPADELAATLGAEIHAQVPVFPLDFFIKNCGLLIKLSLAHAASSLPSPASGEGPGVRAP